jgi:hypothetical protein
MSQTPAAQPHQYVRSPGCSAVPRQHKAPSIQTLDAGLAVPVAAIFSVSYSISIHPRGSPRFAPPLCHKNCSRTIFPCSWNSLITCGAHSTGRISVCACALPGRWKRARAARLVLGHRDVHVRDLPTPPHPRSVVSLPPRRAVAAWGFNIKLCWERTLILRFGSSSRVADSSFTR